MDLGRAAPATVPLPHEVLAHLATALHGARCGPADLAGAELLSLRGDGEGVEVGAWRVPPAGVHPLAPLLGFRAPDRWGATGIAATGRAHRLAEGSGVRRVGEVLHERVVTVLLIARDGATASVHGAPGAVATASTTRPDGLAADLVDRILGRPTPPPEVSPAIITDLDWLERAAANRRPRHGRPPTWRWLADLHPLRGIGPTPEPEDLAERARRRAEDRDWSRILAEHGDEPLPAATVGPPGGHSLPFGRWFDEGSLSRWFLSLLPAPQPHLRHLLAALDPSLGDALVSGLAVVRPEAA